MKKAILFILILQSLVSIQAQTGTPIYSITDGKISVDAFKWVEPFYQDSSINQYPFIEQEQIKLPIASNQFTVSVGTLKDYDDFGDDGFNVICLLKNNKKILEIRQPDFWTLTYGGGSEIDYRKYTSNRYFIPLISEEGTMALAFVGWPYGGDLPLLTIIVITEKNAKMVFNKNVDISEIKQKDGESEIKIKTLLEEYDSCGKLCVAPTYATMIAKDGVLYWKE